jgi:hypothetical protein
VTWRQNIDIWLMQVDVLYIVYITLHFFALKAPKKLFLNDIFYAEMLEKEITDEMIQE